VTGKEAAGVIIAVHPSVSASHPTLQEGVRVAYVADHAYAEYTAVPASCATPIPEGLSTETAAASMLQGLTALTFVREAAGLARPRDTNHQLGVSEGPWALVHAAAGGAGSMLVQMLVVHGAKVIGTAGGEEKCEIARRNGAAWVVDSKKEDVVARVKEITGGKGVDVIFDGVGKATFEADLEMVARRGTVAVFGNAVSACGLWNRVGDG
jgi:NADPH2:quinone reductase